MYEVETAWDQVKQDPRFVKALEDVGLTLNDLRPVARIAFALGYKAGVDEVAKTVVGKVTPVPAPEMPLIVTGQGEYTTHHMIDGTVRRSDNSDLKA
jgi:hypothetical protein